jgi:hypothetical protein
VLRTLERNGFLLRFGRLNGTEQFYLALWAPYGNGFILCFGHHNDYEFLLRFGRQTDTDTERVRPTTSGQRCILHKNYN